MSTLRTWRLAVLLAVAMSTAASADHRDEHGPRRPYTLAIDALVGPSGTDVVMQISATGGVALPLMAEQVLLRTIWGHGRVTSVRHFRHVPLVHGQATFSNLPIAAHTKVSATVVVRIADSHRREVLRANAVALDRPDLRISQVIAPAEIRVGQIANIEVVVQEIRGYRGATFDVLLLEGQTVLDTVTGARIDPLGTTTAAFAVQFAVPGTHALTALIANAVPGEYDTSNNAWSFVIRVTSQVLPTSYTVAYERIEGEFSDNFSVTTITTQNLPNQVIQQRIEKGSLYDEIGRHENLTYSASSDQFVSGVIDFAATIRIDGADKASWTLSGWRPSGSTAGPGWAQNNYQAYDPDSNTSVYIQSSMNFAVPSTVLQYSRTAGDYTFHSSGYVRLWTTITVTDPTTGAVSTTTTFSDSSTPTSGTVLVGSFLDAFQTVQLHTLVSFGGTAIGGWTQAHPVVMTPVTRKWDTTTVDKSGLSTRSWGFETRTYWDASGSGITTP
jgi:hypothetical protein